MMPRTLLVALFIPMALAAPVTAQDFDPTHGVEAVAVLETGRVLVRNGEAVFDCALTATTITAELNDCQIITLTADDALARLAALSEEDWKAFLRRSLIDADCKLSALNIVADTVATAAEANGATLAEVDKMRAILNDKAKTATQAMVGQGLVSFRDGELVLYACP